MAHALAAEWPAALPFPVFASGFLVSGTALPAQDQDKPEEPPDDGASVERVSPYKEALKIYRSRLKRKSLMKRVEGRMLLAATKDPQALKVLTASYKTIVAN